GFGLTLSWEEGVPEWVAPRRFTHERRFPSGPLRQAATEITIDPEADGNASRVRYRVRLDPRSWIVALVLRLGPLKHLGRLIDRLFRQAAEFAIAGRDSGLWAPPAAVSPRVRERILARARLVAEQGYATADRLAQHLIESADADLERMRPRALARQWGREPREVIETCLAAAREGLLALRWDLICPRCHGPKAGAAS